MSEVIPQIKRLLSNYKPSKFANKDKQFAVGELSRRLGVSESHISEQDNVGQETT